MKYVSGKYGGGLDAGYGVVTLFNTTVSGNSAASGGGLRVIPGTTVLLTNTIVAFSPQGGNCTGAAIAASKYSLSGDLTCNLSGWAARPTPTASTRC